MVIQAARKATSSMKCGVEIGASTTRSLEATKIKYAVGSKRRPKGRVISLRRSNCANGIKATAQINAVQCFSGEDPPGSRGWNWCARDLDGVRSV